MDTSTDPMYVWGGREGEGERERGRGREGERERGREGGREREREGEREGWMKRLLLNSLRECVGVYYSCTHNSIEGCSCLVLVYPQTRQLH